MATNFRSTVHSHFVLIQLLGACERNAADQLGYTVRVELYRPDDSLTVTEDANTLILIDYLLQERIISDAEKRASIMTVSDLPDKHFMMTTQLDCKVQNLQKLRDLAQAVAKQSRTTAPATFDPSSGKLSIGGREIHFRRGDLYDMLVVLMRDDESIHELWIYDDEEYYALRGQLNCPATRRYAEFFRTTANNINRRVRDEMGIDKFLIATTSTVQINQQLV